MCAAPHAEWRVGFHTPRTRTGSREAGTTTWITHWGPELLATEGGQRGKGSQVGETAGLNSRRRVREEWLGSDNKGDTGLEPAHQLLALR